MSGYNITIIISLFLMMAPHFYIKRRWAWIIIIPSIIAFVILTGAESSIVRAGIMGIVAALATESGRVSDVKRLLVITAVLMLAYNPYLLVFDIGFQLSFAATIGLVYLPKLIPKLDFFNKPGLSGLFDITTTTLAAQIAVAPLLLYHFGQISLISPIANSLILPIVPFLMALGFITVILSFFLFPVARLLGFAVWLGLEYVFWVVSLF